MSSSKLDEIIEHKRGEIESLKKAQSLTELRRRAENAPAARGFRQKLQAGGNHVIAEVKRKSPSAGEFREDFDPIARARDYHRGGAACLSVLTDEKYFGGSLDLFREIRREVELPCMVKDFILDPYQVYAARAAGADAYLLIARTLPRNKQEELLDTGKSCGMDCLFEVYDEEEIGIAIELGADMIGINNRDLSTFVTDISRSVKLAPLIPDDRVKVALSGISSPDDIRVLNEAGINSFLIGEALSRSDDPAGEIGRLTGR